MKSSVLFSSGFSSVVNISDLLNGNYVRYFTNIGIDTCLGVSHTLLSNSLRSFGKTGGIISSVTISSILNVLNLFKTGDWMRFGLNSISTVSSAGLGYVGA
jgi:hypothetical protein